jgi:hypothetical protein
MSSKAASSGRGVESASNAELIEAESDAHLWAERFDGDTSDLFALQNEITTRIAVALNQELIAVEAPGHRRRSPALSSSGESLRT